MPPEEEKREDIFISWHFLGLHRVDNLGQFTKWKAIWDGRNLV
jgi:hypothetical protein